MRENLFGGLSTACDFVDLVQNGFFTPPVVPLQGSFGHRSALRPLCLLAELVSRFARVGYVSIRQTGSESTKCPSDESRLTHSLPQIMS